MIVDVLKAEGFSLDQFDCVVGRGGLMKAIPGGTYRVNDRMVEDLKNAINGEHASNLGQSLQETSVMRSAYLPLLSIPFL